MARKNRLPPPTGVLVTCKICGETKDENLFPYSRGKRNGLVCRSCNLERKRVLYLTDENTREAAKRRARENPLKNPEQYKESRKRYVEENRDELLSKKRTYQQANRERENQRCSDWYYANKDTQEYKDKIADYRTRSDKQIKASQRKYYLVNIEKFKDAGRKRRKEKPWANTFYTRQYNLAREQRTPSWIDKKAILWFYENRPQGFEVDHIIPLNGDLVSGLHVASNLQFLLGSVNSSKSNKFDPDSFDPYYVPSAWGLGYWDGERCCMPSEFEDSYFIKGWHPLFEDTQEYEDICNNLCPVDTELGFR